MEINSLPPEHDNQEPAEPVLPKKPFKIGWIIGGVIIFILLLGVFQVVSSLSSSGKPAVPKNAQMYQKPQTVQADQAAAYEARVAHEAAELRQRQEQAQQTLDALSRGLGDGTIQPQADGIPPMTAEQQKALAGLGGSSAVGGNNQSATRTAAGGIVDQKRAEREKKLKDALNSTTIALDFTEKTPAVTASLPVRTAPPLIAAAGSAPTAIAEGEPPAKAVSYDFDSANGPAYRIFEGTIIETVLTNRVNGAFAGPINLMVTTPVYSLNHQQLLIPQGTRVIGHVTAVTSTNQQRLFVALTRLIMPDGYSVSLEKFVGLDVVGQTGLRDLVNHHYLSIFGASLAIGAIGGISQIGNSTTGFGYDPSVSLRNGISQQMGQESQQILNRFLNQLPTFIIRERERVKVYISGDLLMPAYDTHTMSPTL